MTVSFDEIMDRLNEMDLEEVVRSTDPNYMPPDYTGVKHTHVAPKTKKGDACLTSCTPGHTLRRLRALLTWRLCLVQQEISKPPEATNGKVDDQETDAAVLKQLCKSL